MRFARESKLSLIEKAFNIDKVLTKIQESYNIAPTHKIVSVVSDGNSRSLVEFKWGLIPSWAKDDSFATKLCNARSETIAEKPSFRNAFKSRRCLIIATGYYEWYSENKQKVPVFFHLNSHKPFGMAGLWESWISPDKEKIDTCSIITTDSNDLIKLIHHRMPVLISSENEDEWLDPTNKDTIALQRLLLPFDPDPMAMYKVSQIVNSTRNNTPDCVIPAESDTLF